MPTPLTFDSGIKFDQPGITWDGVVGSNPATNKMKAIIDFTQYAEGDLPTVAQRIHDQMTLNAATFDPVPVTMVALKALIDDYNAKLAAKASRATEDVDKFHAARAALEDALHDLGNHVNLKAKGRMDIVDQSGFPSYDTAHTPADTGPPAAPANVRVKHGVLSGSAELRYVPDRSPSMNEIQKNTVNPASEADWQDIPGSFSGGKAVIDSLTPGVLTYFRIRTAGLKGVMGAWSDPVQIRVI